MSDGLVVIEGQDAAGRDRTRVARCIALKHALRLEVLGIRVSRGSSAYSTIKREFGLRGSKQSVLAQFTELVDKLIEEGRG